MLGFIAIVLLVAWQKISYYYLSHDLDMYDIDQKEAFARPVLFGGMVLVLADHFWLGSGLASYATYSSGTSVNYSDLNYDYGSYGVYGNNCKYVEIGVKGASKRATEDSGFGCLLQCEN